MIRKGLAVCIILLFIGMNILSTNGMMIFDEDTTPPVTTHEFIGTEGDNDWYVSDVTVELTATDDMSGVNVTYYMVDFEEWTIYDYPIVIINDGEHVIEYYSVDNAGNEEDVKGPYEFKIDQTPPTIDLTAEGSGGTWTLIADVDDETSGVAKVEFYVNDEFLGEVTEAPYEWTYDNASSGDTALAIVYDNAGNSKLSGPPPPPPPQPPILFIGSIKNLDVNNESISFHANVVLILYFYVMPVEIIIDENVTLENDYKGFVGKRFIFARYNYWF